MPMQWSIEFFKDEAGRQPARDWIQSLDADKRASIIAAVETVLTLLGTDVCRSEYGKSLGGGLFEFRVRHDEGTLRRKAGEEASSVRRRRDIVLRLFCHAYGDRVILILGGYDKGVAPGKRRQDREIEIARKRLRTFELRNRRRGRADDEKG